MGISFYWYTRFFTIFILLIFIFLNSNLTDVEESVAGLNGKMMTVKKWGGTNIDPLQWTNIMSFELEPGNYKIEWTVRIGAVQSSNAIWGTRIRWGSELEQEVRNHISNQDGSMSHFKIVELSSKSTVYIDFYHNIAGQYPWVSLKQACITPVQWS